MNENNDLREAIIFNLNALYEGGIDEADFNQSMWDSRKNNDIDRLIKEISNSL